MIGELTVTVEVTKRPLLSRIACLPRVLRDHYRILRRENGRIVSLYAAWLFAGLLLKFKSGEQG